MVHQSLVQVADVRCMPAYGGAKRLLARLHDERPLFEGHPAPDDGLESRGQLIREDDVGVEGRRVFSERLPCVHIRRAPSREGEPMRHRRHATPSSCNGVECVFAFPTGARTIGRVGAHRFDAGVPNA